MKKALFLFMALIVPFFSQSNIFIDGSVPTVSPDIESQTCITGHSSTIYIRSCGDSLHEAKQSACDAIASALPMHEEQIGPPDVTYTSQVCKIVNGDFEIWHSETTQYGDEPDGSPGPKYGPTPIKRTSVLYSNDESIEEVRKCPPDTSPSYTYAVHLDEDGKIDACAVPSSIPPNDSCNINDSPNVQVTAQDACFTKSDGSSCSVTAVDVGGGNKVYMGSEGDCYSDPKPEVSDNPSQIEANPDGTCTNNGGLLACPEDPQNVCGASGSNYGGGSVNNCQSGCGYVNDSFTCYDTDIDSDGLPDYNDPDVDGDGIPNDQDLDNDGDGVDDPIYDGNGSGSSGGTEIDLTPVVTELKKLNEFFKDTTMPPDTIESDLETLNVDYKTDLDNFIAKGSSELGYKDVLILGNASGLSVIPSNSCGAFTIFNQPFDICPAADRVKPILYWLFGMLTAWHIFVLVNQTIKDNS